MSDHFPEELGYTTEHEWMLPVSDTRIRIGITDYAQSQLGDIVYVQLPNQGISVSEGDSIAEIESTKSVSDVYVPVSGKIINTNEQLESSPDLVNSDPYGEGWLFEVELSDKSAVDEAMESALDADSYKKITT